MAKNKNNQGGGSKAPTTGFSASMNVDTMHDDKLPLNQKLGGSAKAMIGGMGGIIVVHFMDKAIDWFFGMVKQKVNDFQSNRQNKADVEDIPGGGDEDNVRELIRKSIESTGASGPGDFKTVRAEFLSFNEEFSDWALLGSLIGQELAKLKA